MAFGQDRWICTCGNFYDVSIRFSYDCPDCNNKKMKLIAAIKTKARVARGEKIKSRSIKAKKAVETRLVNMYFKNKDKFDEALIRLIARDGNKRRANKVIRRIGDINGSIN